MNQPANTRRFNFLVIVLILILAGVSLFAVLHDNGKKPQDIQYVLYLGTNDKDTNEPVFSPDEAKEKAKAILISHFGGYTIQEANGGWVDDAGTLYQEYTLVIHLSDTTLDKVHEACRDMIDTFHQSSVLIQANETTTEFYSGGK